MGDNEHFHLGRCDKAHLTPQMEYSRRKGPSSKHRLTSVTRQLFHSGALEGKRGGDQLDINFVQLRCAQKVLCEVNTQRRRPKGAHYCQVIARGLRGAGSLTCPCHVCSPPSSGGGCVDILQTHCQLSLTFHLISSCPVLSQSRFSWQVSFWSRMWGKGITREEGILCVPMLRLLIQISLRYPFFFLPAHPPGWAHWSLTKPSPALGVSALVLCHPESHPGGT